MHGCDEDDVNPAAGKPRSEERGALLEACDGWRDERATEGYDEHERGVALRTLATKGTP
jgi:hypothetical protein